MKPEYGGSVNLKLGLSISGAAILSLAFFLGSLVHRVETLEQIARDLTTNQSKIVDVVPRIDEKMRINTEALQDIRNRLLRIEASVK